VPQTFTISKGNQAITFNALASKRFDEGPITVSATASSALSVAFSSGTTGVCTVTGSTVVFVAVGNCTIRADQAGDTDWNAATQVAQTFAISKGNQTISFGAIADRRLDQSPFTVGATASSGLTVAFTSATTTVCTVSGTSVTLIKAGTCTINANQAGNTDWNAAPQLQQSFTVTKGNQTITFGPAPSDAGAGGTVTVTATASSGLAVSYGSSTTGVCTVNSSSGVVTVLTSGTCTITADQAGNADWNAAPQTQQSFTAVGVLSIGTVVRDGGNKKVHFAGTNAVASTTITVTICAVNSFPCAAPITTSLAIGPSSGNWASAQSAGNLNGSQTYFAQAVQGTRTSAVFTFSTTSL
jgi:hypothetical protein